MWFSAAASALAMLMGPATLVGFDAAANLAEEAKDAHRTSLDPSTIAASFPM